jgi:hypothetical protein
MINIEQTLDFNDVLPVSENAIEDLLFGCSSNLFTPIQLLAQHSRSDLPLPPIEVINHLVNVFLCGRLALVPTTLSTISIPTTSRAVLPIERKFDPSSKCNLRTFCKT